MKTNFLLVWLMAFATTTVFSQQFTTFPTSPLQQKRMLKTKPLKQDYAGDRATTIVAAAPLITFSGNQALLVERSITNTGDSAICWYFNHMFKNDGEVIDYLLSFVTDPYDTALAQRQLIAAWFDISKPNFSNNTIIFDWQGDSAVFKKEMSITGFLHSMHNVQCGNFFRHEVVALRKTGYFKLEDFETIDVPGHSIGQVKNMGRPIFTDSDAGTGFSWNKNPLSVNGYASIDDIRADTLLINEYYSYQGKVLVDTNSDYCTRSNYRNLLLGNPLWRSSCDPERYVEPIDMSAKYTLPGHSQIKTTLPSMMLALDLADSSSLLRLVAAFNTFQPQYQNGCNWCLDTLMHIIANEFRLSIEALIEYPIYFVMYNSNTDQGKTFGEVFDFDYERETMPVWNISGTNTDTVVLGRDLQMPLIALSVNGIQGTTVFGDTTFADSAAFYLWSAGDTSPLARNAIVNYLQSGFLPPSQQWEIQVAVNAHPAMLSPLNNWEMAVECGTATDLVPVTTVTFLSLNNALTSIPDVSHSTQSILYPNPAQNGVTYTLTEPIGLYDMYGNLVQVLHFGVNDISFLPQGVYIVNKHKLVKQ